MTFWAKQRDCLLGRASHVHFRVFCVCNSNQPDFASHVLQGLICHISAQLVIYFIWQLGVLGVMISPTRGRQGPRNALVLRQMTV